MATRPDGQKSVIAGRALVEMCQVHYEWNHLDAAAECARQGLALCAQWGNVDLQAVCQVMLARLAQAAGRRDEAQAAMRAAAQLAGEHALAPRYAVWVKSSLARLRLAQGDLDSAAQFVQAGGLSAGAEIPYLREPEYLVLLRLLLARGEAGAALALGRGLLQQAQAGRRTGRVIEVLVLQALAWQAKSDLDRALAALEGAVALAQPEGYVRVFLDEGQAMTRLLHHASAHRPGMAYLAELLRALGEISGPAELAAQPAVEPLTRRELEVLRLIAAGQSNQAIAANLVISITTVKRHISNLYAKLGVKSRTQAVSLGRALKLIP
jgi:LuxR family maltose regulon positive regulatory protein